MMVISVLFVSFGYAAAETITYDHRDDFFSYAKTVALLNQEQQVMPIDETEEILTVQLAGLLCKTDGREIALDELTPEYIAAGPNHCFTLFFSTEDLCRRAAKALNETDGIIYAELDHEIYSSTVHDEDAAPFYSWGASRMNFERYVDFAAAWGSGSAEVAVIDSGVFPHSLIERKLLQSGYDYVDADEDALNDLFGHGTSVAGIIADCTENEPVYIYPIRVLDGNGKGKMSNVVNAVREASAYGADVINLSLGSSVMSQALDDAVLEAVSSGAAVVVAAGNGSCDTAKICPAHLENSGVIVVGAAEDGDGAYEKASYSNYGASVDVYAFGTGIRCCSIDGGFSEETGTSMAAPHISALSALMRLIHPDISPQQIERRLKAAAAGDGAVPVPDAAFMIPAEAGFRLSRLKMCEGEALLLSDSAYPRSACEDILFASSNEEVVVYADGCLTALASGTAAVTASCVGLEDQIFEVVVDEQQEASVFLPKALERIEDEAFYGAAEISRVTISDTVREIGEQVFEHCNELRWIYIPDSVTAIGDNSFSEAVVVCGFDSAAHRYAEKNGIQYIIMNE